MSSKYNEEVSNQITNIVENLIALTKDNSFISPVSDAKALGTIISKWSGYDGYVILDIARAALEDANFPTKEIDALIEEVSRLGDGDGY